MDKFLEWADRTITKLGLLIVPIGGTIFICMIVWAVVSSFIK
jgi:hypothetical protein